MGELAEKVKLNLLVYGNDLAENFKTNSLYFFDEYQKSSNLVKQVNVSDLTNGRFYFLHYKDDSNWMKWSPVFLVEYKKYDNKIILFCVNFNFLPLQLRVLIFDKFISEQDFEKNDFLKVKMISIYDELRKQGFEYSLMEFDAVRIVKAHLIHLDALPRFLISGHPKNVYDPNKLVAIAKAKSAKSYLRHAEMMKSTINDFFKISKEIPEKYVTLKKHILRIQANNIKYTSINKK